MGGVPRGKREARSQTFRGRFTTIGELHDHNLAARYHLRQPRPARDIHHIGCSQRYPSLPETYRSANGPANAGMSPCRRLDVR